MNSAGEPGPPHPPPPEGTGQGVARRAGRFWWLIRFPDFIQRRVGKRGFWDI